jgi:hypothetical protein
MPAEAFPAWARAWRTDVDWDDLPALERADLPLLFASAEHRAWVLAVEACLQGKRASPPPLDTHQCRFGEWLDTAGQARYGGLPAFEVLKPLHIKIHALAEAMCYLNAQGQTEAALQRLGELHALRDALLAQMKELLAEKCRPSRR